MGNRGLEARLTARVLVAAGAILAMVGMAAVVVTDRVLDEGDTSSARAFANEARDTVQRELAEGDSVQQALDELLAGAGGDPTVRLTARTADGPPRTLGPPVPALARDTCSTLVDDAGTPWRACEASQGSTSVVAAVPLAKHRQVVSALARGMTGVVVLALLLLWAAVRRAVSGPVAELAGLVRWTARIGQTEDAPPSPLATTREVAHLARAFEGLVRRLLEVLARERAASAHIAHELRTPLAATLAELDALSPADEAAAALGQRLRGDLVRMADVVEAILVLTSPAPAGRSDAVVNVADLARELAPGGALVEAPDEALVEADEALVALALRNLIDNGERHGGGVKRVGVSREGETLRLSVTDGGPGLNGPARARMFDRYWRGSADGPGKGLGLALVRAVAERHGGTADTAVAPSGRGLCVSLTLGRLIGWHEADRLPG
jgi:signal transduction histidine kinase